MKIFTKSLLTLLLLCVAGVVSAQAPKGWQLLSSFDYSKATSYPWFRMGGTFDVYPEEGGLKITNEAATTNNWDVQPFVLDNITCKEGAEYKIIVR